MKKIAEGTTPRGRTIRLTPTEIKVLKFVEQGLSNKEIAAKLGKSGSVPSFHLSNVYRELQVKNRIQAVNKAKRLGLI